MSNTATSATLPATPVLLDFVGKQIDVGDTVVYAVRGGSQLWLTKLRVTQLHTGKLIGYKPEDASQRRITLKNLHTCVVVAKAA
jgi:hypothetical protein